MSLLREKAKDAPPSRERQRMTGTLGLPRRVWYIVGGCLGLMLLSRLFSSGAGSDSHYRATPGLLTAKDYMNASASDPPPFPFCPSFGPDDKIAEKWGQTGLLRSRIHLGTGARLQRVLQKAMSGQPITMSVLGGSVSACHGAGDDVISPRCWPSRVFEWWNQVFPHPYNELTNGAERKSDSAYFAYCSVHHLPDETDIVFLEFDASDPNEPQWLKHFELLVRSILVRPEQPAVILLGHFAPQILVQNGFVGPELLHDVVAQFYDLPHISLKGMLYRDYMLDPEGTRQSFYWDMVLASPAGHELMADLLISYMQSQICTGWAAIMGHAFDVPYMGTDEQTDAQQPAHQKSKEELETEGGGLAAKQRAMRVPPARLSHRPSDILTFREVSPYCVSANDLINPLPPSHFYGSGWKAHHPRKGSEEDRHYWFATDPGARMRVPLNISAGEVAIYYLQSPMSEAAGRVACWVDDDYDGRMELRGNAEVDDLTTTLTTINEDVTPGSHYVECLLLGPQGSTTAPFKMLGVFAT